MSVNRSPKLCQESRVWWLLKYAKYIVIVAFPYESLHMTLVSAHQWSHKPGV